LGRTDTAAAGNASATDSRLAARAVRAELTGELRQQVLRRADGVPLFLLSFVQSLLSGAAEGPGRERVPAGIRQSIRQRLLALPPHAHELLGLVAVAGRQIQRRLLLQVAAHLGRDVQSLLAALEPACQAGLLADDHSGEIGFTHELIREVILEDLAPTRRTAWHLALGEVMEQLGETERERQAASLAVHFVGAGEHARALPYALRAGDRAEASYAHAEAEHYYRQALELARALDDTARQNVQAQAEEKLGTVLAVVARYGEALELLEVAGAGYALLGHVDAQARVVAQVGAVYASLGTAASGIERLQREVIELEAGGASAARLAEVLLALALLYRDNGRYDDHLHAAQRAAELASATTDAPLQARAEARLGVGLLMVERNQEGAAILERTLPRLEAVGDLRNFAMALNSLAVAHETLEGDFALARGYLNRAVQSAERLGDPTLLAFMLSRLGTNAFATGDWQAALGDLERALSLSKKADGTWTATYPLINLGRLYLAMGRRKQAWSYLAPALEVVERNGDLQAMRAAYIALGESEILTGRADRAHERLEHLVARVSADDQIFAMLPYLAWAALVDEGGTERPAALLERAHAQAKRSHNRPVLANVLRVSGLVLTRERRYEEATAAIDESMTHARATCDPYGVAKSLYAYAQLHEARGEREAARERYQEALAICVRLGEGLYRPHIQRALAAIADPD
jgi:tetratricopeptide (TPR) repeat protein